MICAIKSRLNRWDACNRGAYCRTFSYVSWVIDMVCAFLFRTLAGLGNETQAGGGAAGDRVRRDGVHVRRVRVDAQGYAQALPDRVTQRRRPRALVSREERRAETHHSQGNVNMVNGWTRPNFRSEFCDGRKKARLDLRVPFSNVSGWRSRRCVPTSGTISAWPGSSSTRTGPWRAWAWARR